MKSTAFLLIFCLLSFVTQAQNFTEEPIDIPLNGKSVKGIITLPRGNGPFPAVLIIQGSGATDLDGNTMGMQGKNNALKMLAEALAENGIAALRYNKRIFAGFSETELRFDHFVDDAVTAFSILKNDNRFDQVGIAGHSQGSLVGILAAQRVSANFFVSIAGPGLPFDQIISEQLKSNPYNPADLITQAEDIMKKLKKGETVADVPPLLAALFRPSVQEFIISWMKYDPAEEIQKLDVPIMIVNGTTDIQVTVKDAETLYNNIEEAQRSKLIVEGMNHVLKDAPEDRIANMATYTNPELAINTTFQNGVINFIKKNTSK